MKMNCLDSYQMWPLVDAWPLLITVCLLLLCILSDYYSKVVCAFQCGSYWHQGHLWILIIRSSMSCNVNSHWCQGLMQIQNHSACKCKLLRGPISTLLQHIPNEYASIRTSAGYLSKEIASGIARGCVHDIVGSSAPISATMHNSCVYCYHRHLAVNSLTVHVGYYTTASSNKI